MLVLVIDLGTGNGMAWDAIRSLARSELGSSTSVVAGVVLFFPGVRSALYNSNVQWLDRVS